MSQNENICDSCNSAYSELFWYAINEYDGYYLCADCYEKTSYEAETNKENN